MNVGIKIGIFLACMILLNACEEKQIKHVNFNGDTLELDIINEIYTLKKNKQVFFLNSYYYKYDKQKKLWLACYGDLKKCKAVEKRSLPNYLKEYEPFHG